VRCSHVKSVLRKRFGKFTDPTVRKIVIGEILAHLDAIGDIGATHNVTERSEP
jgi:hypothetical protein